MAVSGRKQSDMLGSIAAGSTEDFDHRCEPCLTIGQLVEAHRFCVQCQEYLCKTCHDYHRRMKATRSHQIFGLDQLDKIQTIRKSYNECTEKCPLHQKEIIKFYCPKHANLGCSDCMTIGHRTCKIDYIPEKCVDIANGKAYNDIMMRIGEKLKEADEVSKKAKSSCSAINDINKEVIKKIAEFRAEINACLDRMQQDIIDDVEEKKSTDKRIVQNIIDTCGNIISDVKKLKSSIRANKSNNQNGQLYTDIKRAESALKSDELSKTKEELLNVHIYYSFRRNADVENLFSKEMVFGELINHLRPESTKKKNTITPLTIKDSIIVKTKTDQNECYITGCAILPSNKLVLADYNNIKLKVVSVKNKSVQEEKELESYPWDIAVMSQNQFAVTLPETRRVDVMTTDDKLCRVRSIKLNGKCFGITAHQDCLYVVCLNPSSVVVLTTQGNELRNIPLNFLTYCIPYIALRKDSYLLYISDNHNNVVSVSLQGSVSAAYKHEDFQGPSGMCLLDDGSLLVCCNNGTIHQIKDNLKEGNMVITYNACPWSICYCACNDEVYVGCSGDKMNILSKTLPLKEQKHFKNIQ